MHNLAFYFIWPLSLYYIVNSNREQFFDDVILPRNGCVNVLGQTKTDIPGSFLHMAILKNLELIEVIHGIHNSIYERC